MAAHSMQFALYARNRKTGTRIFVAAFEDRDTADRLADTLLPNALDSGIELKIVRVGGTIRELMA